MEKKDLFDYLQRCGYYIHSQKGKKFGQYRILLILRKEGQIQQKKLQDILKIQSGSISEILSKLESRCLIKRFRDELDKRRILISLTEEGYKTIIAIEEEFKNEEQYLFDTLDEDECEQLGSILKKLCDEWRVIDNV